MAGVLAKNTMVGSAADAASSSAAGETINFKITPDTVVTFLAKATDSFLFSILVLRWPSWCVFNVEVNA